MPLGEIVPLERLQHIDGGIRPGMTATDLEQRRRDRGAGFHGKEGRMATSTIRKGERAKLEAELRTLTTKKQGQTSTEVKRVREIRERLGLDGGASSRSNGNGGGRRRRKYPPEITAAVRRAKEIRGKSTGAPGAKQHVAVRKLIGDRDPLEVVGMSDRALRQAASGSMPTAKLREQDGLRALAAEANDQFCTGRNLASIVAALVDERKGKSA